jgi:hypothetical protein
LLEFPEVTAERDASLTVSGDTAALSGVNRRMLEHATVRV